MKIKCKIYRILFLAMLLLPLSGYSQQQILTGMVRDKSGPLIGATVYIQNENERVISGIATDLNGEYYLTLPGNTQGLKIIFSFVGFKTQQFDYTGQRTLNVVLEEDSQMLAGVSVTARSIERNSFGVPTRNLGVARQKIDMEEMSEMQVTSIEDALQGRLGNVDIIASSGDPGSKMAIRIRGTSSLNANNEPLIVVDGIPLNTTVNEDFDFATADEEDFGALVNISPNDIESIEVLKDAGATAMWGSKGSNGVLLITTKRGTQGKTRFSITQKVDFKYEPKVIPMLNGKQYVTMVQDAIWNRLHDIGYHWSYMALMTRYPEINFDPDFIYFNEYNQNTDWLSEIKSKNNITSNTDFAMSGGGERALYRFSLSYLDEGGTTIGTGFKRLTSRLNVDYKFSNKLRVSANFYFAQGNREANWTDKDALIKARSHAIVKMPNMSPYILDENGNRTGEYFVPVATSSYTPFQGTWGSGSTGDWPFNPIAMVKDSRNSTQSRDANVAFNLYYEILTGLIFKSDIGINISAKTNKKFLPQSATGVSNTNAYFNQSEDLKSDRLSIYINNTLIWTKLVNETHRFTVSAITQTSEVSDASYSSAVYGVGSEGLGDPANGGHIYSIGSGTSKQRDVGFIGNFNYSYKDRYIINGAYRYEGNSRMGKNRRWGGFPSATLTWRFSDEFFLREQEWLDDGKLRLSWGKSGNTPGGSYPYVGTFSPNGSYLGMAGVSPNTIQLNNLKWEVVTDKNLGLDLDMLNNKMTVSFDLYDHVTSDMLQKDSGVSTTTGFSKVSYFNSGKMKNYGWEFRVDYRDIVKIGDFSLSGNFNISRNRNKVLELPFNLSYESYNFGNGNYAQNVVEGDPLGSFYGYKYEGVYQTKEETIARDKNGQPIMNMMGDPVYMTINNIELQPGDARYADINNDGVIDKYDIVYLGNSMPILTGGFGLTARYKNFRLRTFFQGRIGQYAINRTRINTENMYSYKNQSQAVLKRWRHTGDDTDIPRALYGRGYNYLGSDRFVDKATFVRMKNLTLTYSLDKSIVSRLGLQRAEVYITGYDLWTITKYKGQNPEVGFQGGNNKIYQLAEDNSDTPRPIRFAVGVTVDF